MGYGHAFRWSAWWGGGPRRQELCRSARAIELLAVGSIDCAEQQRVPKPCTRPHPTYERAELPIVRCGGSVAPEYCPTHDRGKAVFKVFRGVHVCSRGALSDAGGISGRETVGGSSFKCSFDGLHRFIADKGTRCAARRRSTSSGGLSQLQLMGGGGRSQHIESESSGDVSPCRTKRWPWRSRAPSGIPASKVASKRTTQSHGTRAAATLNGRESWRRLAVLDREGVGGSRRGEEGERRQYQRAHWHVHGAGQPQIPTGIAAAANATGVTVACLGEIRVGRAA